MRTMGVRTASKAHAGRPSCDSSSHARSLGRDSDHAAPRFFGAETRPSRPPNLQGEFAAAVEVANADSGIRGVASNRTHGDARTRAAVPKHYTKDPWWGIIVAGIIAAFVPLVFYGRLPNSLKEQGLLAAMSTFGGLGTVASIPLIARSHIRSIAWSNVVLWCGILFM